MINLKTVSDDGNKRDGTFAPDVKLGEFVPGKGVYLGVWTPEDRKGRSLNQSFNLFAAPHDLVNGRSRGKFLGSYADNIGAISRTDLFGHGTTPAKNDTELYNALRNGQYNGEWFMPTIDILNGRNQKGEYVQSNNLCALAEVGALKNTFSRNSFFGVYRPDYWSCTRVPGSPNKVFTANFATGTTGTEHTTGVLGWLVGEFPSPLTRLVRAEPRP